MLLRNYDNIMSAMRLPKPYGSSVYVESPNSSFSDSSFAYKSLTGAVRNRIYDCEAPFMVINRPHVDAVASARTQLMFGSGNTPVTYDDYKLSAPISDSELVALNTPMSFSSILYDATEKKFYRTFSIKYTAAVELTIKEYGFNVSTTYAQGSSDNALIFRELLNEPIELSEGQNITFTFKISASANDNKPEISLV